MNETHQDPLAASGPAGANPQNERLVDYLYDELSPEDRAAFEDELAQSPTLAAELASLRGTRARFAALPVEVMPRGLLDDVLAEADARAATFAKASAQPPVAGSFFERALEGLRRLVFQPAFAMGMVLFLVAGVALIATRNPNEIAGMELARDVQRLPPVAMAPAPPKAAPAAEAAPSPEPAPREEAAPAELAAAQTEPAVAESQAMRMESAKRAEAKEDAPARYVEARVRGDFDDLEPRRPEQPRPSKPTTSTPGATGTAGASGTKDMSAKLADAVPGDAGPLAAPALGNSARGGAAEGDADTFAETVASGGKANAAPAVADRPVPDSSNTPKAESVASKESERARTDNVREENERTDKKVSRDAPVDTAKAPARQAEPSRKAGSDDQAADVAPAAPANKPTEPVTGERLYTTLKQQLAAGALADADKSLSELARLEGETTRVKQARDALNRAKAASQARPADTKPLPEPASTPR